MFLWAWIITYEKKLVKGFGDVESVTFISASSKDVQTLGSYFFEEIGEGA
jgi:hypothetical protein